MGKFIVLLILGLWCVFSWYATKKIIFYKNMKEYDDFCKSELDLAKKVDSWYREEIKKEGLEDDEE